MRIDRPGFRRLLDESRTTDPDRIVSGAARRRIGARAYQPIRAHTKASVFGRRPHRGVPLRCIGIGAEP
ncbi:hypothetical protein IFM12276_32420 [Nocardia sputorum]|uniref:Uncharacterized protein n=1 Tax=Nocardia sputorum TaxID=2984338 RepID=A0ABM8CYX4_9NOCA|nr:hypothetical protein IFM12276_32420 [Nocardia sputorum]